MIDTHSPNSPISSDRSLAVYPSSWMHSSISAAVNGVLMMGLPVFVASFRFEPSTISREVTRFATFTDSFLCWQGLDIFEVSHLRLGIYKDADLGICIPRWGILGTRNELVLVEGVARLWSST